MRMRVPIIAVTGTKGKTTTVAVIADVLKKLQHNVLKVDTTGHFVNGERRSTLGESKSTWYLVPTVSPGRYMYEFLLHQDLQKKGVAVLECSLGCSALSGMGYRYHRVGVFLNVFEDHLGSSERVKTKQDIADAKAFIFNRLDREQSYAVFNADDELVVSKLTALSDDRKDSTLLPCGMEFSAFDHTKHLTQGGSVITVDEKKQVVLRNSARDKVLFDTKRIPWTFNGNFQPSLWNLMHAAAAVIGFYGGRTPKGFRKAFESSRLDADGGRLTLLRSANNVTILADYAHEKKSMQQVGRLGRTLLGENGRLIGVVRLAHDRTDVLMRETGHAISLEYDKFFVYDKIDGYLRKVKRKTGSFPEVVGRTSEIFSKAIASINPNVERIIREDKAIEKAAKTSRPGDVVVVIVNDDIERSLSFIKKYFKAELV